VLAQREDYAAIRLTPSVRYGFACAIGGSTNWNFDGRCRSNLMSWISVASLLV